MGTWRSWATRNTAAIYIRSISPPLRALVGRGFTIEEPTQCGDVLERALTTKGPVVVEAVVDPFVPPLPAKIALQQATKFARSLARGEPNRARIAWTAISDKVRELI
jgi:pyruvate dehydrogenase (quinone)/pyruvate oxidase